MIESKPISLKERFQRIENMINNQGSRSYSNLGADITMQLLEIVREQQGEISNIKLQLNDTVGTRTEDRKVECNVDKA